MARTPQQGSDSMGPEIAGYSWRRFLGRGGSAEVHEYKQLQPQRRVAIKVSRADQGRAALEAMRQELDVLARVSTHPGIVSLYASGNTDEGQLWFALELGQPPRWHRGAAPLSVAEVLRAGVLLAGAAASLHAAGYVHRDIKPANVLISEFGGPMLSDFGTALPLHAQTRSSDGGFSIPWAAPEVHHAETRLCPAQDVYSLAATIWTWLAGSSPFEIPGGDNTRAAIVQRVLSAPLRGIGRRDVPPELERVLAQGMSREPQRRPSAADFGRLLQQQQRALGLPETELEIRTGSRTSAVETTIDPDATRLRPTAVVVAEPHRRSFEFSDQRHVAQSTSEALQSNTGLPVAGDPHRGGRPVGVLGIFLAVFAAMVLAGVVLLVVLRGGGWTLSPQTPPTAQVQRPVVDAPQQVRDLRVELREGQVVASWMPPADLPTVSGHAYGYRVARSGEEEVADTTDATTVTFPAATGTNCIQVWVRGERGTTSLEQQACITG